MLSDLSPSIVLISEGRAGSDATVCNKFAGTNTFSTKQEKNAPPTKWKEEPCDLQLEQTLFYLLRCVCPSFRNLSLLTPERSLHTVHFSYTAAHYSSAQWLCQLTAVPDGPKDLRDGCS